MTDTAVEFWNNRYKQNPRLGSGLGSRGENIYYKRGLLEQVVARFSPGSVLDVGCGDQYVAGSLADELYTGIDISPVIVKKNRENYPRRTFIEGDFLAVSLPPFDLTICFDVVIHLDSYLKYRQFIRRLVELTAGVGIISGYEEPLPLDGESSFIHYYEPLSKTLRNVGAGNLEYLGKYRGTAVYLFSREGGRRQLTGSHSFKPVFLVGTMRSGTTLLAELLGAHPEIVYCPFELKSIWSRVGGVAMASPKTGDTRCPALTAREARRVQAVKLEAAFQRLLQKYRGNKQQEVLFLNKNPHLCNKLPFVNGLFPGAKFIWIYRDLNRVASSLKKLLSGKQWHYWPVKSDGKPRCWEYYPGSPPAKVDRRRLFPGGDIQFLAEYWYESNRAVRDFSRTIPGSRLLAVREEELVLTPRNTLASCQAFLGVNLNIPGAVARIDSRRNEFWVNNLHERELRSLLQFLSQNDQGIEYTVGQTGIVKVWKRELENLLKGRKI